LFTALPKKDRDHAAVLELLAIERVPRAFEQFGRVAQLLPRRRTDCIFERRIVETAHRHRRDRGAVARALETQHLLMAEIEHALKRRPVADRPVHRHGRDVELALELADQLERIARGLIEFVDEAEDRDVPHAADLEELARLRLDAFRAVEHHHRAVGGGERAVRVLAEVLVARRVEQVQDSALELELQNRRGDGDAAALLHRHPVGRGVALLLAGADGAGLFDRAAVEEELLGEGGLAGVGVGNDGERAPARHFPPELRLADRREVEAQRRRSRILLHRFLPDRARIREVASLDHRHSFRKRRRRLVERDRLAHAPRRDPLRRIDGRVARRILQRILATFVRDLFQARRRPFAFREERRSRLQKAREHLDARAADCVDLKHVMLHAFAVDVVHPGVELPHLRLAAESLDVEMRIARTGHRPRIAQDQCIGTIDAMDELFDERLDVLIVLRRADDGDVMRVAEIVCRRQHALEDDARRERERCGCEHGRGAEEDEHGECRPHAAEILAHLLLSRISPACDST
jgi:hypothetical protein